MYYEYLSNKCQLYFYILITYLLGQLLMYSSNFVGNSKELWKTVTTVSNQGRMRGRAKGLMRIKDLSKGQKLGFGKNRMVFPGLTTAIKAKEPGSTKVEEMSKESYEQYLDQRFVPSIRNIDVILSYLKLIVNV